MSKRQVVTQLFEANRINLVGDLVEDPDLENGFLAFVRLTRDEKGRVQPSTRTLASLNVAVVKVGSSVRTVFLDDKASDTEAALRAMLMESHSDKIESVVASVERSGVYTWIETSLDFDAAQIVEIERDVSRLLGFLGLKSTQVVFTKALTLPTTTALLGTIRKFAPLTKEELISRLVEAKFDAPPQAWLNKALDLGRRRGLLLRRADEKFLLTLEGLNLLGTRRNRMSPDVSRVLAMARKK